MDLSAFAAADLEALAAALSAARLAWPPSALDLRAQGLQSVSAVAQTLGDLDRPAALAVVQAVLAERRAAKSPELVWTGPEAKWSGARDTAVVLADLFDSAQQSVLLVGFAFDHGKTLLAPLHAAMSRGVACRIFAEAAGANTFLADHWPFGPPFPSVHRFVPEAGVFASLHAKCVVVDAARVLVTSANFTDRGQTRNIEVGILLEDSRLAGTLEAQFAASPWFR